MEASNPKERMGTAGPSQIVQHFSELNTLGPTDKLRGWGKYYTWRKGLIEQRCTTQICIPSQLKTLRMPGTAQPGKSYLSAPEV